MAILRAGGVSIVVLSAVGLGEDSGSLLELVELLEALDDGLEELD